ncbi:unnamed protein product [Tetraodon nigroviridis]|uniref:(spotted green pufferfish) hypothetical protein n=1 Tax=Tetraodon nigroviridis TaxID=99883 RepID=Q4RRS5_TETNG|nr:unnamed protein product [Tetraodon nigroviridis]
MINGGPFGSSFIAQRGKTTKHSPTDAGAHGVREEPRFVTARAGESVILGCDVSPPLDGQQPPYVVEWFKFGVPIPFFINFRFYPPHVDPEYTGRASLHGKASLQIDPVRSEDQGWYECRVLMLEQQYDTFHNGSWVHLTVNAPPSFTATPPQYVEAKEGGSTVLSCSAQGNPKPMISWLREGEELATNAKYTVRKVHDGSLTILGITRDDRGAYTCRAYSDQGEVLHTTRLLVQGIAISPALHYKSTLWPPYIVSPPENVTVNISQNALFTCQAEAYPGNLTYTWFWEEDNVYFKNDLKLRVRILIDGTLIIFRVKPEDAGKYTCTPSNSLGISPSASAHLTVQYPARVINMPPVIYVPRKLPGIIRCPVDANPPVTSVKWEKDGYPLRVEKYPGWSLTPDGSIRVAEATEDSLGTYTCVPYNALGTMGMSPQATLVLKDPPYFNVRPGGEYRQEAGRELVIPCAASGDPDIPTITWRKVGKPSKSKHNVLPSGSLQFLSLSKEDHGEWECVATNVVTSITASTRILVIGTSPHAPGNIHVLPSMTSANVSWEPGYDGGFEQTFSVWYGPVSKRTDFGPHDWHSMPVSGAQTWLVVPGLEPGTEYQFSVLAQNKLGTGPFSEVVTVNTTGSPLGTPEPLVLLTPPRCLTANRTQHGVLLTWLPPANHSSPIDRYIMEFRLGERWEVLDDLIPSTETEFIARDLVQDSWYEFRVMAVMVDLISESSNVVGVSSTDPPLSVTHFRKSIESPPPLTPLPGVEPCWDDPARSTFLPPPASPLLSSGKISPESSPPSRPRSLSSEGSHGPGLYVKKLPSPQKEREKELSFYKKTKRAIASKKYSVSKHEAEVTTPIELISRGPDGRFVMESSPPPRRIQGFPFAEESDMYPEFRQSDEENDFDPGPLPPIMPTLRPQLSPTSSSLESTQPPTYSPRLHRPMEVACSSPQQAQDSFSWKSPWLPQAETGPWAPPVRRLAMQQAQSLGQLRHTAHGVGVPVLPYPDPAARAGSPSTAPSSSPQSWLSPRAGRRADPSLPPLVLQPSRLSPLSQSPLSTQPGSPDILVRPPPRPGILRTSRSLEMPEITLQPSATVSFSRRSSLTTSPTQGARQPSPSYHAHMSYASTAASYPSQSPSPPPEGRDVFGQRPSQRRTEEEMLPSEPSQLQISASGEPLGASSDPAGSESLPALLQHCITKAKGGAANNNNNTTSVRGTGACPSQTQQQSQTPPEGEDLSLHRKRKRQNKKNPYLYLTSLLHRRQSEEDQTGILASADSEGPNYGTLR